MEIIIVAGSQRPRSQTAKVAEYLRRRIASHRYVANAEVIDLAENPLPLWDETVRSRERSRWSDVWKPISERLHRADAFALCTPEWSGMATPALKNLLLLCSGGELAHKPALLVGVSASSGGSYPLAELRMSSHKNTRVCHLPEQLVVRNVRDMLNTGEPASDQDRDLRARVQFSVDILLAYARALGAMRAETALPIDRFPHGM